MRVVASHPAANGNAAVPAGSVVTIIEILDEGVYLVELANEDGETLAMPVLRTDDLVPWQSRVDAQ